MPPSRAIASATENIHIPAGQRRNICGRGRGRGQGWPGGGGRSNGGDANEERPDLEPIKREIVKEDQPKRSPTPEDIEDEKLLEIKVEEIKST